MSRYIDAEKLKAAVRDKYKSLPDRCEINSIIDLQPTADVRENVRGEWISHIEDDGYIECPFCQHATNCDSTEEQRELHYCFYCGAELK